MKQQIKSKASCRSGRSTEREEVIAMIDLSTKRFLCPAISKEGIPFVIAGFIFTLLLCTGFAFLHRWLAWYGVVCAAILGVGLTYAIYLFFRDPERVSPDDPALVLSPADGFVSLIQEVPLPKEFGTEFGTDPVWRVSVFMSVLNVHVNRMPVGGTIVKDVYVPGAFINASLDKASEKNERHLYLVKTDQGQQVAFVQIAGLIARRIVSRVSEGQKLQRGERFGLIRFGSRLDIYLPKGVLPSVKLGQMMVAGETPLARL